jgi:hypothetical protein
MLGRELAYRLYTEESLQLRSKRPRRRKMVVARRERYVPKRGNQAWSMDFVADQLADGRKLRALTVVVPSRAKRCVSEWAKNYVAKMLSMPATGWLPNAERLCGSLSTMEASFRVD